MNNSRKPARGEPALSGRLIDRNNAANFPRLRSFFLPLFCFSENLEIGIDQLQLAAIEVHLAVERDQLPGLKLVLQVGTVEPYTFQPPAALADGQLKDRHATSAEQARGADLRN